MLHVYHGLTMVTIEGFTTWLHYPFPGDTQQLVSVNSDPRVCEGPNDVAKRHNNIMKTRLEAAALHVHLDGSHSVVTVSANMFSSVCLVRSVTHER